MTSIELTLDPESVGKAQKALKAYAKKVRSGSERTCSILADIGRESAQQTYDSYPKSHSTGELGSSITVEKTAGGAMVVADCYHADFFEFGTGVVGQDNPYPHPNDASRSYEVGEKVGGPGHFTHDGKDAWMYGSTITSGMPSRPFMAPAALVMRASVEKAAKEAFRW